MENVAHNSLPFGCTWVLRRGGKRDETERLSAMGWHSVGLLVVHLLVEGMRH